MSSSKTSSTQPEKADDPETASDSEFNELCTEAHANAVADRAVLKRHLRKLRKTIGLDPDRLILGSDAVTKTAETMSKLNGQIIQIAQLKMKNSRPATAALDGSFSDAETEELYERVEHATDPQN